MLPRYRATEDASTLVPDAPPPAEGVDDRWWWQRAKDKVVGAPKSPETARDAKATAAVAERAAAPPKAPARVDSNDL